MKKFFAIFFIFLFSMMIFSETFKIDGSSEDGFKVEKLNNKYVIKLKSFEYFLKEGFLKIDVKNGFKTSKYGYPELPSYRFLISSKDENLDLKNVKIGQQKIINIQIPEKGIYPLQKPVIKSQNNNQFFIDEKFYNSNEKFPDKIIDLKFLGKRKDEYIYQVEINPIVYDRKENKLFYHENIEFELKEIIKQSEIQKSSLKRKILFVVNSTMKPFLQNFIKLKNKQGFYTEILLLDTVGYTKEQIKNGILNVYNNSIVPLEYVLLVGDVNLIPNYIGTETDFPPTDLYYTTLEGIDFLPDVGIGRFSVTDTSTLKVIVERNINYQNSLFNNTNNWTKKGYFMASDDASFHQVAESTHLYVMEKLRDSLMVIDSLFYYNETGTPISTAINSGRSLAVYSGHGSVTSWAGPTFYQSDILSLTNGDMLPFVSSYACLTGNYAYSSDCFGETWVKSGKSIAYLGSSVYSYWDEDDIMERKFFDYYIDSNYTNVSDLIYFAKLNVLNTFPSTGKRYFEQYNLLGDPSFEFYTNYDSLYIDVFSAIPSSNYDFDLFVYNRTNGLPVKNVKVSYILHDSLIDVGITDENGKITFYLFGETGDTIKFYAFKNNYKPDSSYSVITSSTFYPYIKKLIIKDTLFYFNQPDGNFTSADSGYVSLMVENNGLQPLLSLSCSVFVFTGNVKLYSNIFNFKDTILPSDSCFSLNSILFKVRDNVKNKTYDSLGFKFFSGDSSLNTKKRFFIYAPETKIETLFVISKNTSIFSNDTVDLRVKLKNYSNENDRKLKISIISNDTNKLSIIPESFDIPYLNGNDTFSVSGFTGYVKDLPLDTLYTVGLKIVYTDTLGFADTFFKTIYINKKDYLVLNYAKSSNSGFYIDSILKSWGYAGDLLNSIEYQNLTNYNYVFLTLGSYPNNYVIPSYDPVALMIDSLLNNGNIKLYIEGGEAFYWDPLYNNAFNFNYLCHVNPKSDGTSTSPSIYYGTGGTIGEGMILNYTPTSYNDLIDSINGSKRVFYNGLSGYVVSYKNDKYRTVASSIEFGNVVDNDSINSKRGWLRRIMDFFELKLNIEDLSLENDGEFKLLSIENSFKNNKISVVFTSKDNEKIKLKIYDITGRQLYSVDIIGNNGVNKYMVDLSSKKISSKILFVKLINEKNEEFTGKILFIK
ncbi:MAG: C25 family cysteine peptidase [candidate division WOR-3 bacterium]